MPTISTGFSPELSSGIGNMALINPSFQSSSSESASQSDLINTSDSHEFRLDSTVQSGFLDARRFSHYELVSPIGEGQFGTVWRAKDLRLNRVIALKLPHLADFDERRRTLFLREARAAAVLEHPNIVQVYGVEQDGDQPGIISQFIEGTTLFHQLQGQRPEFDEAARIIAIVADAVHHAHEAGVIHRDLKPSNILMDAEGQPHVSDFGLAKWSEDHSMLTNPGLVLGTPAYMSPEQARGDSHLVDRRSDVYSLGVLLYELLTGKPPFEGNSTLLLHQIQSQDPRAPRSLDKTIPLDLETICLKCLAKLPDDRYATAHELAADLQRFLANEPITARSVSLAERCARWTRRNPMVAALVSVSVLSTFTAIGLGASLLGAATRNTESALSTLPKPVQAINVSLKTEPEGATVVFYPLDPATGEPDLSHAVRPKEKSPIKVDLAPGDYLVVAALPDGRFHEVYRHVPHDVRREQRTFSHCNWRILCENSISLTPVKLWSANNESNMSPFVGATSGTTISATQELWPFLLDQHEVKVGEVLPKFGNRLPPSLNHRTDLLLLPDLPITGLFFDEAMSYAEYSGKRLPTALEYEFAATNGWTTLFPWGDSEPPAEAWQLSSTDKVFDQTQTIKPVYGLFSNASEFVFSGWLPPEYGPTSRFLILSPELGGPIVRGGPISDPTNLPDLMTQGARWRVNSPRTLLSSFVGFRCAKSKSPRL